MFSPPSCYRFAGGGDGLDWLAAEVACEANGAHLAIPDDPDEAAVIDGLAPANNQNHWIGVSDRRGTYLDVTGRPAAYQAWVSGSPADGPDCVEFRDDRQLASLDCAVVNDYMCEYDGRLADPTAF